MCTSERTSGRFVTRDENVLKELHKELAGRYLDEFVEKLQKIGMNEKEISDFIKEAGNGKNRD